MNMKFCFDPKKGNDSGTEDKDSRDFSENDSNSYDFIIDEK